jgi:hypothetical protein
VVFLKLVRLESAQAIFSVLRKEGGRIEK